MKKTQIMKEVVGKKLEPYGFRYLKTDSQCRYFIREVPGVGRVYDPDDDVARQYVNIQESRFAKRMTVRFHTDVSNPMNGDPLRILEELSPQAGSPWFPYEDEASYRATLSTLADIIIQYGIDFLDQMSIEEEIIPTKEMADELYRDHAQLDRLFIEEHHLDPVPRSDEDFDRWSDTIQQLIRDTSAHPYEDVKDLLVQMAAFIGERACEILGQEWEFSEDTSAPCTSGRRYRSVNPLRKVVYLWREHRKGRADLRWLEDEIVLMKDGFWASKTGPEFVLTTEAMERLDAERHALSDRFREKHGLDDSAFDEEHIRTWLDAEDKAFKAWKDYNYEDALWDMLEIVAFFSVQMERYMGARWEKVRRGSGYTYIMKGIHIKGAIQDLELLGLMDDACTIPTLGNCFDYNIRSLFEKRVQ